MNKLFYKTSFLFLFLGGLAPLSFAMSEYDDLILQELSGGPVKPVVKSAKIKTSQPIKSPQKTHSEHTQAKVKAFPKVDKKQVKEVVSKTSYKLSVMLVECLSKDEAKPLRLPHKVQEELNEAKKEGALLTNHTACAPLLAHIVRRSAIPLNMNKAQSDDARRLVAFKYQRPIVKQNKSGNYYLETAYEDGSQTLGTFLSAWLKADQNKLRLNLYAHAFTTDGNLEEVVYHNHDKVFVHTRPQVLERVLLVSELMGLDKEYILSGDVYMRRQAPENLKKLMPEKGRLWAVVQLSEQ